MIGMSTISTCARREARPPRKPPLPYSTAAASPKKITMTCTSDRLSACERRHLLLIGDY
jgi:hypothetical protein